VAADNRLDDKETLGDFGAGKSLRCQELVKRITGGSQGCDDGKKEEGHANCSIGVDQWFCSIFLVRLPTRSPCSRQVTLVQCMPPVGDSASRTPLD